MAKVSKFLGAAAVAATLSLVATAAEATPYTAGSFSISVQTDTTTDVTTTTKSGTQSSMSEEVYEHAEPKRLHYGF